MGEATVISPLSNGVNQKGVRNHNERLILSLLQRSGELPGSEVARQTHLSAQTVSVIMRKLEGDGLVRKGKPVKGRVGKPSVPMALNPRGAFSIGCKIGRRSSDLFLTDLCGTVLFKRHLHYDIALPRTIFEFLAQGYRDSLELLGPRQATRLSGIGIAAPFEIWKWGATDGNTPEEFLSWKDISFEQEVARFTDLPLFLVNDATSACWAEHLYGRGRLLRNYAYFFVAFFIGGGVVLNQSVYSGARGNAAAFGPLRVGDRQGHTRQLMDVASIHVLEGYLAKAGHDPRELWVQPQDWSSFAPQVDLWLEEAAYAIAQACISVCAVIDFEAVLLDGFFPDDVKCRLVERVRHFLPLEDSRGLILPDVLSGQVGIDARAIGAACIPTFSQYFLSTNAMRSD
jgi:predicted NBD/HSP70 family sugar kinase